MRCSLRSRLLVVALCAGGLAGAFLGTGCRATGAGPAPVALAQPGWGRSFPPPEERATVRAVPASARPRVPGVRLFRPGWGWSAGR